jgi:uncharacterized protein YchJ
MVVDNQICPCGTGSIYKGCCGRIHNNIYLANNALELIGMSLLFIKMEIF